jgi:hypothetical protein
MWVKGDHLDIFSEWKPDEDKNFIAAFNSMPEITSPIHRGLNMTDGQIEKLHVGQTFNQSGFRSWSSSSGIAVDWAERHAKNPVVLTITDPKGAKDFSSVNPIQHEAVLGKSQLKVTNIFKHDSFLSVSMEIVSSEVLAQATPEEKAKLEEKTKTKPTGHVTETPEFKA